MEIMKMGEDGEKIGGEKGKPGKERSNCKRRWRSKDLFCV
jgi:hypothetical protein